MKSVGETRHIPENGYFVNDVSVSTDAGISNEINTLPAPLKIGEKGYLDKVLSTSFPDYCQENVKDPLERVHVGKSEDKIENNMQVKNLNETWVKCSSTLDTGS